VSELDHAAAARTLRSARRAGRTLDVLLSSERGLSLADAYRVQDQVTALRLAGGERRAGWKLGYTSAVMRAQMGVDAPNFGPLTDAMLLDSPAVLPAGALQPRIEPEIGLRLRRRLAGPCSVSDVLDACDAALACLEVVDSVWSGYRFTLEDNTADGSSAAWVAVGPVMPVSDLAALPVALSVDGEVVESGTGAAASGHPAAGVAWLAEQLAAGGRALEPGDLVITGGLTSAHPLEPGHRISASFGDGRWLAEVCRAATGLRFLYRNGKEGS
jgi:2-keto-4-pentenoate hydratase